MPASHETLEELHHVCGPEESSLCADQTLTFEHFVALRRLTLSEWMPPCACWQSRLPLSLQSLTITAAQPHSLFKPAHRWVARLVTVETFTPFACYCFALAFRS